MLQDLRYAVRVLRFRDSTHDLVTQLPSAVLEP